MLFNEKYIFDINKIAKIEYYCRECGKLIGIKTPLYVKYFIELKKKKYWYSFLFKKKYCIFCGNKLT